MWIRGEAVANERRQLSSTGQSTQTDEDHQQQVNETFDISLSGSETPLREHMQLTPLRSEIVGRGKCKVHHREQKEEVRRVDCVLSSVHRDVHSTSPGSYSIRQAEASCPERCSEYQAEITRIKCVLSKLHKDVRSLRQQLFCYTDSEATFDRSELNGSGSDDSTSTPASSIRKTPQSLFSEDISYNSEPKKNSVHHHKTKANGQLPQFEKKSDWFRNLTYFLSFALLAVLCFSFLSLGEPQFTKSEPSRLRCNCCICRSPLSTIRCSLLAKYGESVESCRTCGQHSCRSMRPHPLNARLSPRVRTAAGPVHRHAIAPAPVCSPVPVT